jgi:L-iditol 2-dehydrogenase
MGQRDLHMPRVLGHEAAGFIAEVGDGVSGYRTGDRVALHPGLFCGECGECSSGLDHLCEKMRILGFNEDGGFQEYIKVPALGVRLGTALHIADDMPFSSAALAEPLACTINMAESLRPDKEDDLLIIGAGAMGLLTAKLWRGYGVERITLLDVNETKVDIAREIGFNAERVDASGSSRDGAYSVAVACCPGGDALAAAAAALKKRGRLGFFSGLTGNSPGIKTINDIHYRELRVFGAYGCSLGHTRRALALLGGGIAVEDFLIRRISIDELESDLKGLERDAIFTQLDLTDGGLPE